MGDHSNPSDKPFDICQQIFLGLKNHLCSFHDLRNSYDVFLFTFDGGFFLLSTFRFFASQRSCIQRLFSLLRTSIWRYLLRLNHLLHFGFDETKVVLALGVDGQTVVD